MPYTTAAEIDRQYRSLWDAYCSKQISEEVFAALLADLRRAMRSLGA